MGVPNVDIAFARKPVAMFLNASNDVEFFLLEPHLSRFFIHKKYGIFEIDANCASRSGKTPLYFYYSEYPKPIHLRYYGMLYKWAKKNGVDRITKKDIRHSGIFDRIKAQNKESSPLEGLKKYAAETSEKIQQRVNEVNQLINEENERRMEKGEPPSNVDPNDYAQYILEKLILDNLVTKEDATKISYELASGQITIDDFIEKLKDLNVVNIVEPIPLHPRRWLEDFPTFKPSDVFSYIKMSRGLGKAIEKLGLKQVHNLIPWTWVLGIVLVIIIGIAALMSTGILNNLGNITHFKLF